MELNIQDWKEFNISRTTKQPGLMSIVQCKCGCAGDLEEGNDICYIGAKKSDNGIMKHVKHIESMVSKGNGIMIICDGQGSVGYSNYIKDDFIGSTTTSVGYDDEINQLRAMFIVTCLDLNKYKYSYGRKYRPSMNSAIIKLPIQRNLDGTTLKDTTKKYSKEGYIPDWQFMEDYIKSLHHLPITTKIKTNNQKDLDIDKWEVFKVSKLFNKIYKAKAHTKEDVAETAKGVHFVSRTDCNNGVDIRVDKNVQYNGIEDANCITIGDTTATCFYQNEQFIAGDHIVVLRADWLNLKRGLFLKTLFDQENIRYCYGRAYRMDLIKKTELKLPILRDQEGNHVVDKKLTFSDKGYIPDWQFMEDYINSLPYSDRI